MHDELQQQQQHRRENDQHSLLKKQYTYNRVPLLCLREVYAPFVIAHPFERERE